MSAEMFRPLSDFEEHEFRQWARENYKAFDDINSLWHPVIQEECATMNIEALNKQSR